MWVKEEAWQSPRGQPLSSPSDASLAWPGGLRHTSEALAPNRQRCPWFPRRALLWGVLPERTTVRMITLKFVSQDLYITSVAPTEVTVQEL